VNTNAIEPAGMLPDGIPPMSGRWVAILRGESALAFPQRAGRRVFALMPSASRCKFCNAPFKGRYAGALKTVGYTPSRKNPRICARCIERAPEGGAVVPVTVLFADVRGYTALCERLKPDEVTELVQRFYETSSAALLAQEGLLGQIAGDEIEGLFVPGLAGANYRRKAVEASRSLVRAIRYTESAAGSLEVGIGVASGEEFVGNVAGGGYKDFAAVGHVTNTAARLTATARDGQIVVDAETYEDVARGSRTQRARSCRSRESTLPSWPTGSLRSSR
jgi:adenylate cyclase